jgi:hypothetical protein
VNPLDEMLKNHLTPMLAASGFAKRGRTYSLAAPNGDLAIVDFQSWRLHVGAVGFFVNLAIVPTVMVEWLRRNESGPPEKINDAQGFWRDRLLVSEEYEPAGEFGREQLWEFKEIDSGDACGAILARVLERGVLSTLTWLVDRSNLLAAVRDPLTDPTLIKVRPRERALIVLLVDEGPSDELETLLRQVEQKDPDDIVATWARQRLAEKGGR